MPRAIPGEGLHGAQAGCAAAAPAVLELLLPPSVPQPADISPVHRLTAFVLKSFGQARAYVAIEERHITDALLWLQKQQKTTGCFRSVGKLFNNALQVGWGGRTCSQSWAGPSTSLACAQGSGGRPVLVARHGRTHLLLSPLQGGVSDELSLSAYVTAAMLELGLSPTVRMTPSSLEGLVG